VNTNMYLGFNMFYSPAASWYVSFLMTVENPIGVPYQNTLLTRNPSVGKVMLLTKFISPHLHPSFRVMFFFFKDPNGYVCNSYRTSIDVYIDRYDDWHVPQNDWRWERMVTTGFNYFPIKTVDFYRLFYLLIKNI
jgi:hypothetical protein